MTSQSQRTIPQAFLEQVVARPEKVALRHGRATMTYAELEHDANELAARLITRGVAPGDTVGLCLPRSTELVVGMLAALKCGAAYLPVDSSAPTAWVCRQLGEANTKLVVYDSVQPVPGSDFLCQALPRGVEAFDRSSEHSRAMGALPVDTSTSEDASAYVMYTSGSSGVQKGVRVPHRAVVRLVQNTNYITIKDNDRVLIMAPPSFDASTFEIWGPLLNGATGVIYEGTVFDPGRFACLLRSEGVNIAWLTAGLFHLLAERNPGLFGELHTLLAGGDVLYPRLVNKVLDANPGLTLINGYGPTENTTFTTCYRMNSTNRPEGRVPIGRSISGTLVHLLDPGSLEVPDGTEGELVVSGRGVALGYLRDEHNLGAFFRDPKIAPGLLYRTGDFAVRNSRGNLEFLGRRDNLTKIRGFRVSLDEVQEAMCALEGVTGAVARVETLDSGDQKLVVHVQVAQAQSEENLCLQLANVVPPQMVPDQVVINASLPISTNGKIDRRALARRREETSTQDHRLTPTIG